jgi:hypothetical protein
MSTRNICKRPLFFSLCALALGTWRPCASSRLEINLSKSSRAYRGQSVTSTYTPHVHWLVTNPYRGSPRPCSSAPHRLPPCPTGTHLPNCLNVCRPTVCTLDHRGLSVLRLHPTCTYAVSPASCLSSPPSRLQPDTVVHSSTGAAIETRYHALHSASSSCRRRHRAGNSDRSSQGMRCGC